jgi:formylglycine-generating enzyme required for sulfatase activity
MSSQSQVSERTETPQADPLADMVFVPGGEFRMGSTATIPRKRQRTGLASALLDRQRAVTNRQFGRFVNATKHVTFAEIAEGEDYRGRCRTC